MTIQSAKAKGRRLAQEVRATLLDHAPDLTNDDIFVVSSSVVGEDLKFSARARSVYPFTVECKNQEKLNVWNSLEQAEAHARGTGYLPLLIFSRNRSKQYVAIEFKKFLKLIRGKE